MKKILFALLLAASTAALAEPLGMVIDVQGNATLGKSRLEMLSYLNAGNDIDLASGASMTVTWYAGAKELKFAGPARLKVEPAGIKVNLASPGFTKTNLNGYEGVESIEDGSREVVRVALLGPDGPTGTFTRWENAPIPW